MLIRELTPQDCREIIRSTQVARLACAHNDQPYVVPVSYSFDAARDCLYCFSAVGQKILWMRDNPKVCVQFEEIHDKDHWATVLVFGRYEELRDSESDRDTRERALALFQTRDEWWLPGAAHPKARDRHAVIVYRIQIERVSGRRASRQSP
jgi:nitroimidazol reductase NimA-like FMN-containing flavoprotein (pyridoxamine 5'-phosphate oxidase superfamily)